MDGKTFRDDLMVMALSVTIEGNKVILGFVLTARENEALCSAFLQELMDRGLKIDQRELEAVA